MNMRLRYLIYAILIASLALLVVLPAMAASVTPEVVGGNPQCSEYGLLQFAYFENNYNTTINGITVSSGDGTYFDWSSTIGVDLVIAKGGPNANLYFYDPESFGDTGLHSPDHPNPGQIPGLSHITFCGDYELSATKTANASYDRTVTWDITKVEDEGFVGFAGDSFNFDYDVTIDKTEVLGNYLLSGVVTVHNPAPFAVDYSVTDIIDFGGPVDLGTICSGTLAAGASVDCPYSYPGLPPAFSGTNYATAHSSTPGVGDSLPAMAPFAYVENLIGDDFVNFTDDLYPGFNQGVNGDTNINIPSSYQCLTDPAAYTDGHYVDSETNTGTISGANTNQSDSATKTFHCYLPSVIKTVNTDFDRYWEWTIVKEADQTELLLSDGQLFQVNYEVTVDATYSDTWQVDGTISVYNPATIGLTINSVTDVIAGFGGSTNVNCGVVFPYVLAAGGTLNCTYDTGLQNGTPADSTNTATAYFGNGTNGSDTKDVIFGAPDEIDECIDVNDTNVGFLGTVCAGDAPKTFNYSLWFGAHPDADVLLECGENWHENIADFVTNDTGATGSDNWIVYADVACDFGCTLTPGYWKTHSIYGPAPYDDTWAQIGEDTPFFLSGQSYYQVLWTAPQGGNAYYILAHAYIAAELNFLNGASVPADVQDAFDDATALFSTYTPEYVAGLKGKSGNELRAEFIALAGILDGYNNGLTGPGHCSE